MIKTTIRLKPQILERLDDAAHRLGLSKNQIVEMAVDAHLTKIANKIAKFAQATPTQP